MREGRGAPLCLAQTWTSTIVFLALNSWRRVTINRVTNNYYGAYREADLRRMPSRTRGARSGAAEIRGATSDPFAVAVMSSPV